MSDPHGIKKMREEKGLTQRALAALVGGINYQTIQRLEKGKDAGGSDTSRVLNSVLAALGMQPVANTLANSRLPAFSASDRIPVYALRENAAHTGVEMTGLILSTVPRPDFLAGASDAYAIEQRGTKMSPMYRPGYVLAVHPHIAPRAEAGVVIMDEAKSDIRVCEFVSEDDANWHVKEYGAHPREFDIDKASHPLCHSICMVIPSR